MGDERPLIGISASEVREAQTIRQIKEGEPPSHEVSLGLSYIESVTAADALGVVLPPVPSRLVPNLLDRIDGICLSGGPDVDPSHYGAEPDPNLGPTDPDFDRFEIELARVAIERGMPILAICRGIQVFNVSRGGTLIQHLPDADQATLDHRQDEPGDQPGHGVRLDPDSRIAGLMGRSETAVNTFHHQAVDELGDDLKAVGWADDGLIEAIEIPDHDFAIGTQWHAELMVEGQAGPPLFNGLAEAAGEYGRSRQVPA